jgi:hypothetical protein
LKRLPPVFLILFACTIILESCVPFFKPGFNVSDFKIERKSNGYFVWFTANKRIDGVEAFVSNSNWLIITIVDTSIDLEKIRSTKPTGIIQSIETERFKSSVQVSMKLSENVERVEVVHDPGTYDIGIDLFTIQKN